ncbi:MBL fold metallo-hydrolase [Sediminicoccus sp. BL-A-41-H5]|uniref:MBL fold metallo-hydrolase n=1 Tax=Sediminicoccus sp. BL-A-41-H5 TaxID=3421106 RepID=UPI003D672079
MTDRRHLLAATGALLAAPALIGGAVAQTAAPAAAPSQAPGFYRFRVGGFVATTVWDGFAPRQNPGRGWIVNADQAAVEGALRDAMLSTARLDNPFIVTFLETPAGLTMFDSGTGGQLAPTAGRMRENLAAAGIDPARVTRILVSHFHGDHITGLTTAENAAVFPNAQVFVPEVEWAFWTDSSNSGSVPEFQRGTFANVTRRFGPYQGKVERFAAGAEILPGVRAVAAYGHTPGHTVFHVADGADQLFVTADTASRPELFLRNPGWTSIFDIDGPTATASRIAIFDRIAAERARMTAYHFPFPANGFVQRMGEGFRFVPADWTNAI